MSLISTRNLIAPLTNKLHMIAVLLLTVLFVALRLSGGAIKVDSTGAARAQRSVAEDLIELPPVRAERPAASPARQSGRSLEDFNSVVKSVRPPWEQPRKAAPPPPAEEPARKKGGFDDIEKALGLK